MLLQALPFTKESGEGILIDTKTKAAKHECEQQLGGVGGLARHIWKKKQLVAHEG
jgi:hypothetical protein